MDFGGDTAYVFIAMIVLSDENGILKHTADSLARVICKDVTAVTLAIEHLQSEDPDSNLSAHEGRRIVPLKELNEDETRGWFVVNKNHYRDKKDLEEIRTQTRERVRRFREKQAGGNAVKRDVTPGNAGKRHTDTDTDTKEAAAKDAALDPIWGVGLQVLLHGGVSENQARSFIGLQLASWTPADVLEALQAAGGKADPRSYVRGVLRSKPKKGESSIKVDL